MRRITIVALVAVLALLGAACGGDDDDSGGEDTETADDGATTDDGGDDGDDGDIAAGFLDEDCRFLLAGAFMNPLAAAQGGDDADVDAANEQLEEIADEAPDEIRDAMHKIAEVYSEFAEALKDADVDLSDPSSFTDPEVQQALAEIGEKFDEEYQEAADTVSQYVQENCTAASN